MPDGITQALRHGNYCGALEMNSFRDAVSGSWWRRALSIIEITIELNGRYATLAEAREALDAARVLDETTTAAGLAAMPNTIDGDALEAHAPRGSGACGVDEVRACWVPRRAALLRLLRACVGEGGAERIADADAELRAACDAPAGADAGAADSGERGIDGVTLSDGGGGDDWPTLLAIARCAVIFARADLTAEADADAASELARALGVARASLCRRGASLAAAFGCEVQHTPADLADLASYAQLQLPALTVLRHVWGAKASAGRGRRKKGSAAEPSAEPAAEPGSAGAASSGADVVRAELRELDARVLADISALVAALPAARSAASAALDDDGVTGCFGETEAARRAVEEQRAEVRTSCKGALEAIGASLAYAATAWRRASKGA